MPLTDIKVKNARPSEKPVKLTDGQGLYLLFHPSGSKYWQLAYRFGGKQKVFSIGVDRSLQRKRNSPIEQPDNPLLHLGKRDQVPSAAQGADVSGTY